MCSTLLLRRTGTLGTQFSVLLSLSAPKTWCVRQAFRCHPTMLAYLWNSGRSAKAVDFPPLCFSRSVGVKCSRQGQGSSPTKEASLLFWNLTDTKRPELLRQRGEL